VVSVIQPTWRAGTTDSLTLSTERVRVDKEAVVTEEVALRTEAVERRQQVPETVRREELDVGDPNNLVNEGRTRTRNTQTANTQTNLDQQDRRFESGR
jgi:stress response protein YsnF